LLKREVSEIRNIPNVITALRIALSIALLFTSPLSPVFFIIYIICGLTDMIDGYLARKMRITSKLGSKLDSIADMVFIAVMIVILVPILNLSKWILIWILLIAIIRIISVIIALHKYHKFAGLHTYSNKATGLALFCFTILLNFTEIHVLASVMCTMASLSAVEELIIQLFSKELDSDIKGLPWIFEKKKQP
jgi:CDP-diacylglycerol--glycerol-3-phosphate 3-phosphatidyltransferase